MQPPCFYKARCERQEEHPQEEVHSQTFNRRIGNGWGENPSAAAYQWSASAYAVSEWADHAIAPVEGTRSGAVF